ncbi:dehydrogenase reductase protein [Purpureocillium lavendulum]|uniref:Dehydrogenase reductase protein n=1 Tax=Purpureocillium lavendulum TaxID=1247861 RepID=A0AB34GAX0_9HYPO|nr:dehydrogenase reductase protein [Purpureocillium lavendulum]
MTWSRSIIITGGTANLGYETALNIARAQPDVLVVLSSRSDKDRAAESINKSLGQSNAVFIPLDLASLDNVRKYCEQWRRDQRPPIQALVLNAGLQFPGGLTKTSDGLESTFAINHVGHALLFHLLWPSFADRARVVVTSSGTHDPAQKTGLPDAVYRTAEDLAHPPASMVDAPGRQRYASSKLANVLWAYALDRRLAQKKPERSVTVTAFDPGLMPGTGLAREANGVVRFLWLRVLPNMLPLLRLALTPNIHTPAESGSALARLAVGEEVDGVSGKYYEGKTEIQSSKDSYDVTKQDDLWRWTTAYLARSRQEALEFDELK